MTPLHLAIVLFEDPEGIGRQAVLKCAGEDTLRSIIRVLKKKLVKLPQVNPPPDQARPGFEVPLKNTFSLARFQREKGSSRRD